METDFPEATEKHAREFFERIDADVLIQIINPYDNNRDTWKQTRIDFLMTLITEAENEQRIF